MRESCSIVVSTVQKQVALSCRTKSRNLPTREFFRSGPRERSSYVVGHDWLSFAMQRGPPIGVSMTRTACGTKCGRSFARTCFSSPRTDCGVVYASGIRITSNVLRVQEGPLSFMQDGLQSRFEHSNPSVDRSCIVTGEGKTFRRV